MKTQTSCVPTPFALKVRPHRVGTSSDLIHRGAAEQYATYLGDEDRRWKNIVLDMSGKNLSFGQKKAVIDILFPSMTGHDWHPSVS